MNMNEQVYRNADAIFYKMYNLVNTMIRTCFHPSLLILAFSPNIREDKILKFSQLTVKNSSSTENQRKTRCRLHSNLVSRD